MSRSYKRNPGFADGEGHPGIKKFYLRLMNKKIRKSNLFIPNGNTYRLFIDRWDYRDWEHRFFTQKQIRESWYFKDNKVYLVYMK